MDQTVPVGGKPVLESGTGSERQPTIKLERRSPYTENDCRHKHRVCDYGLQMASTGELAQSLTRAGVCAVYTGGWRMEL